MLARLQQLMTFGLLACALSWWVFLYPYSPVLAVTGFLLIVLAYAVVLGLEFFLLRYINQDDPAPLATLAELLRAWRGESLVAPLIFCWRQPFRAAAIPDNLAPSDVRSGQRGVVFIHGFFCNRGFWNPWLERLQGSGHAFVAVSLEPVFGSIDDYIPAVEAAVQQVTDATGLPPLLVCHSMGGLVARAWLQAMRGDARVHHIVTIGTPHQGTWLARFSRSLNGQQMQRVSSWRSRLDDGMPAGRPALFTCWYSNSDNIVFPTSTATLPGADNCLLRGKAHVQMAFVPQLVEATLALLQTNKV